MNENGLWPTLSSVHQIMYHFPSLTNRKTLIFGYQGHVFSEANSHSLHHIKIYPAITGNDFCSLNWWPPYLGNVLENPNHFTVSRKMERLCVCWRWRDASLIPVNPFGPFPLHCWLHSLGEHGEFKVAVVMVFWDCLFMIGIFYS